MRLLLINPKFPESFWSFSWALEKVTRDKKAVNSPLGLATLAALTPDHWEISIVDENVEPINWSARADIIGVCGMGVQVPRQKEILAHFRKKGIYTVAGGSYASLCPEEYRDSADTVVAGEAEKIWKEFCADFEKGAPQSLYQETGEIDLSLSPAPRYDLLKTDLYQKVSLQFSRGCPFRCEFCDIIVMFGRKPRTKSLEQVEQELDHLRVLGARSLFFVDDNLIGHLPMAKKFLAFLADYQRRHRYRFSLGTEASINMAADPELMKLFRAANFEWVFIGIETPSEAGLKETKKEQNLRGDLLSSVQTIYSYGLDIFAGFIVGFDADEADIFERQYQFIVASGIAVAMVGLLMAIPKTPLYARLAEAHRLRDHPTSDNTRPATNVIPLRMSYEELVNGYEALHARLADEQAIFQRIRSKLRFLRRPVSSHHFSRRQKILYFSRVLFRGILAGGFSRIYYFVRSCLPALRRPRQLAVVITDWIAALSLNSFRERHFDKTPARLEKALRELQESLKGLVVPRLGVLQGVGHLWLDLKESLDRVEIRDLSRSIRRTLRRSHEKIVIDCSASGGRAFQESGSVQLQHLLRKLRRYRHQVHLRVSEPLYRMLEGELAIFNYTLVAV